MENEYVKVILQNIGRSIVHNWSIFNMRTLIKK